MRLILTIFFCMHSVLAFTSDTTLLKVHFLYGSRPSKAYRNTESKWFGGILGGHVGIEVDSGKVLNFLPEGKFHVFAKKNEPHSRFADHSYEGFYSILGGHPDSMKKAIVYIPISQPQKQKLDSIASAYLNQVPYDYALFGMRCGAAAYDILGHLDILPAYAPSKTYKKIFYPKKLRKRLFIQAKENGWTIVRQNGSQRRKWEKD